MADISSITIKNKTYDIKDKKAREWATKADEIVKTTLNKANEAATKAEEFSQKAEEYSQKAEDSFNSITSGLASKVDKKYVEKSVSNIMQNAICDSALNVNITSDSIYIKSTEPRTVSFSIFGFGLDCNYFAPAGSIQGTIAVTKNGESESTISTIITGAYVDLISPMLSENEYRIAITLNSVDGNEHRIRFSATELEFDDYVPESALDTHLANKKNPHNVTAEQVGTYNKDTIENMLPKTVEELEDAHLYFRNDNNASINNSGTGTINVAAELVQFNSNVEVTGQLSGIIDPVDPLDVANKQYVDEKMNSVSTESLKQYVDEKIDSIPMAASSTVDTDFSNVVISSFYDTGEEESHVNPIYDKATTTWTFPYVLGETSGYITFDLFKAGDEVSFIASTIKIEGNNDSIDAFMKINGKTRTISSDWTPVLKTTLTGPIKFTSYNASIAIKMSSTSSVGVSGLMSASDKGKLDAIPSKVYSTEETYNKAEIEAKLEALKNTVGVDAYSKSEVDAKLDQLITSIVNIYGGNAEDLKNGSV